MAQRIEIATTIRTRREKLGLTQDWLAREVGCAFTVVSRWECGRAVPRQKFAEALVRSLGGVVSDYRDR